MKCDKFLVNINNIIKKICNIGYKRRFDHYQMQQLFERISNMLQEETEYFSRWGITMNTAPGNLEIIEG